MTVARLSSENRTAHRGRVAEIGRGGWLTILAAIAGSVTMVIAGMAGIAVGAVMIGVIGVVAAAVVSRRTHSTRWVILLLTALLPLTSLTFLAPAAQQGLGKVREAVCRWHISWSVAV